MKKEQLENKTKKNTLPTILNLKNSMLFLCMVLLIGSGCFKPAIDHNVTWKGKILEKGTNKPVPNAKIFLYEFEFGSDFTTIKPRILIETYQSDKDGNYEFTYLNEVKKGYVIKVIADKYYLSEEYTPNDKN